LSSFVSNCDIVIYLSLYVLVFLEIH